MLPTTKELERGAWEKLRGPGSEDVQRTLTEQFDKMFPQGHRNSLRALARALMDPAELEGSLALPCCQQLAQFHPRAFGLLACYGVSYEPHVYREELRGAAWGECSRNSYVAMQAGNERLRSVRDPIEIVYVEGLCLGPLTDAMLHAWNAHNLEGKIAYDWTFCAGAPWIRYLGVPFTENEYATACALISPEPRPYLLFDRTVFEKVEFYLLELLRKRMKRRRCAGRC